jgi:hypothetical protein
MSMVTQGLGSGGGASIVVVTELNGTIKEKNALVGTIKEATLSGTIAVKSSLAGTVQVKTALAGTIKQTTLEGTIK